jgi:hypothetical protein
VVVLPLPVVVLPLAVVVLQLYCQRSYDMHTPCLWLH